MGGKGKGKGKGGRGKPSTPPPPMPAAPVASAAPKLSLAEKIAIKKAENAKKRRTELGLPETATDAECDEMESKLFPPPVEPEPMKDPFAVPGLRSSISIWLNDTGAAAGGGKAQLSSPDVLLELFRARPDMKLCLVDFFAYSCTNCLRTIPGLCDLYAAFADKGTAFVVKISSFMGLSTACAENVKRQCFSNFELLLHVCTKGLGWWHSIVQSSISRPRRPTWLGL